MPFRTGAHQRFSSSRIFREPHCAQHFSPLYKTQPFFTSLFIIVYQLIHFSTSVSAALFFILPRSPTMATTNPEHREEEENAPAEDEDTGAQVAPIVKLEEVAVTTGEEDEDAILDLKAKLYRFDKEGKQWKERGAGTVKLLKHKVSGRVRLVMRQSKTLKICANHLVLPNMSVQEHAGNDKSCVWHASDYADGELKDELFCIRFASVENCKTFIDIFQEVVESQKKQEENKDASATAGLLEKLTVGEKVSTDKESETEPEKEDAERRDGDGEAPPPA